MALSPTSSRSGGNTTAQVVASGSVLPVADATGVTVDSTTYNDTIKGSGKLTTLVFPADQGALAFAISGDAFPRLLFAANPGNGLYFGNGTVDPYGQNASLYWVDANTLGVGSYLKVAGAAHTTDAPKMSQVSPIFSIQSGALPTQQFVTGTGAQLADPGTGRDVETVTPFTGDGTNNVASLAVAISPDNSTYSTLDTLSIAAALNLTGVLSLSANVRVPAGWYLRLTASHGTIGVTTYY